MGQCTSRSASRASSAERLDSIATSAIYTQNSPSPPSKSHEPSIQRTDALDLSIPQKALFEEIDKIPLFRPCSTKQKIQITKAVVIRNYVRGDLLIEQHHDVIDFMIIMDGLCTVTVDDKPCAQITTHDHCGEDVFLQNTKYKSTVKVHSTNVRAFCLNLNTNPELWFLSKTIYFINRTDRENVSLFTLSADRFSQIPDRDENSSSDSVQSADRLMKRFAVRERTENRKWLCQQMRHCVLFGHLFPDQIALISRCFKEIEREYMRSIVELDTLSEHQPSLFLIRCGHVYDRRKAVMMRRGDFFGGPRDVIWNRTQRISSFSMTADQKASGEELATIQEAAESSSKPLYGRSEPMLLRKSGRFSENEELESICKSVDSAHGPRSESDRFVAVDLVTLYQLDMFVYQQIVSRLEKVNQLKIARFLKSMALFGSLLHFEVMALSERMKITHYVSAEVIAQRGDPTKFWGLIMSGRAVLISGLGEDDDDSGTDGVCSAPQKLKLRKTGYFGDRELIEGTVNAVSVIAESEVCVLSILAEDFHFILGALQPLFEGEYPLNVPLRRELSEFNSFSKTTFSVNDFILGQFVGRGHYGTVRMVRHRESETLYVLKMVEKSWIVDSGGSLKKYCYESLYRERDALKVCSDNDCRFVVRLFGSFSGRRFVYLVLEPGSINLAMYLSSRKRSSLGIGRELRFYVGCIVVAVEYLHRHRMIHRDVKPENVVIASTGYLKLCDFGLVRWLKKGERASTRCGTTGFMAPEVMLGADYSFAADWWSVGCTLYALCTGISPFGSREDRDRMVIDGMNGRPILKWPPDTMTTELGTSDLHHLIEKLMAFNPRNRFAFRQHGGLRQHGGIDRICGHSYFDGFSWNDLREQKLSPPLVFDLQFIPNSEDPEDLPMNKKQLNKYRTFELPENKDLLRNF